MKFETTDNINLRTSPSVSSVSLGVIPAGTVVESDEHTWKAVTLHDGRKGFCAAEYLVRTVTPPSDKWYTPIRYDKFKITQTFLSPDPATYPKTGHHPGVDYGTQGEQNVPLFFCTSGEVIENGVHPQFGNYFFFYVASVDRTFVYFHLRDSAPAKGTYNGGTSCGIAGTTGLSTGIHVHLECIKGRKTSANRSALYTSKSALMAAAEDADAFIRARL